MRLELTNQVLDCFLAGVILLLDGRMGQSLDPQVNFTATSTATGFPVHAENGRRTFSRQSLQCPGVHNTSSV